MLERANRQPSGSAPSAVGQCFGTLRLRELLAARGDAGLWLARDEDDDGGELLLRLYPGLPTLDEWHKLELAASQLLYVVDPRLVPIKEIALDIWPRLTFACPGAEALSRRIARELMTPAAAVAMCADVARALAALGLAGVPPVDVSPADIVLVGDRARLLADVGLPGGKVAHACVDLAHAAPERVAAIAGRREGVPVEPGAAHPTAASMTYALASIVTAAIHGPRPLGADRDGDAGGGAPTALPARLEQVLRRGLASDPSERYATPAALVEALAEATGVARDGRGTAAGRAARVPRVRDAGDARDPRRSPSDRWTPPARRTLAIAAPAAAAVLAAAAIGTLAGSATTPADPPAAVTLAGAGVSVQAPQGWLRGSERDVPPGFGAAALAARPPGRSTATALVVTRTAAPLLARLADAEPAAVQLGAQAAWRYRDVAIDGERVADLYVLQDGEGPLVAACIGPSGAPPALHARCSAALTTLRLRSGRAVALGGDAAARRGLAETVADLARTRASERRALATAATGRGQAATADRLAAAYARAGARAGRAGPVGAPGDLARLVDRLEATGRAYGALATAAREARRAAYAQARERIAAQERALGVDLAALAAASPGS